MASASIIATAMYAAAKACNRDPLKVFSAEHGYQRVRVLAAIALVRRGYYRPFEAAGACNCPRKCLSASQWKKSNITEADVATVVLAVPGAAPSAAPPSPPEPIAAQAEPVAAPMRRAPYVPVPKRLPAQQVRTVSVQTVKDHHVLSDWTCRRNDTDRKPPRQVVTARLMGDPEPGRFPWTAGAKS